MLEKKMAVKIIIKSFHVEKLHPGQKTIDVSFDYAVVDEKTTNNSLRRKFAIENNIVNFVLGVLLEIKKEAESSGKKVEIAEEEQMKEKLVNTLNRLILEVSDLKKIKNQESYMRTFNKINCYRINFY